MSLTPTKRTISDDGDVTFKNNAGVADIVLSPAANAELFNALNIEAGRLKSDMGMSPLPEGIEVGRRVSELSPARGEELVLPMSPLRSSLAAQEQADLLVDWGANDNNNLTGLGEDGDADQQNELELPLLSPPQSVTKPKRSKRPRQTSSSAPPSILMDDETELTNTMNASLPLPLRVRKAVAKKDLMTLLNQPLGSDHLFADLFKEITLSSPQRRPITPEEPNIEQQPPAEEAMNGDEVYWGQPEENIRYEEDQERQMDQEQQLQQQQEGTEPLANELTFAVEELPFDLTSFMIGSGMTRRQAASTFFNVLLGACNNEYRPVQIQPFGQIILENF